jgi:hypothetical protein
MLTVPTADVEEALVRWVREWLDMLAAGRLAEACARLDAPAPDGERWTPERIVALVQDTYGEGTPFRREHPEGPMFTPVASAGDRLRVDVIEYEDGSGYWIDHDVPLNGGASDLTAQFEFTRRGGEFEVMLHDLHVM